MRSLPRLALAFAALLSPSTVSAQSCPLPTVDRLSVAELTLGDDDLRTVIDGIEDRVDAPVLPSKDTLGTPTAAGQIAFDPMSSRMLIAMPTSAAETSFAWRDPHSWRCYGGYADGVVDSGEECDDGNSASNDGCHGCVGSRIAALESSVASLLSDVDNVEAVVAGHTTILGSNAQLTDCFRVDWGVCMDGANQCDCPAGYALIGLFRAQGDGVTAGLGWIDGGTCCRVNLK